MRRAVIVDAIRTPVGKRNGKLRDYHPVDLAALPLQALTERNQLDPGLVDDVIMGCVTQTGEQGFNVGRNAALAAGFPEDVVGTTIDRQCGSGQQAAHFAAQGVMAGAYEIAIAAGVESMTRVPMGANAQQGPGRPFGPAMMERYADSLVPQGISAEMIAEKWSLSRDYLDRLACDSHRRAAQAIEEGRFSREILPVEVGLNGSSELMVNDEGIRTATTPEVLAGLQPAFKPDGVITAALAGVDPVSMLTGPIPATARVLEKAGLDIDDIDLFEVNEAFASVIGAWLTEHGGADPAGLWERTNVNGGAISMGHPLGGTGAKLTTTLVHEMERRSARYGLQTMCEGGGMANAMIIERVS